MPKFTLIGRDGFSGNSRWTVDSSGGFDFFVVAGSAFGIEGLTGGRVDTVAILYQPIITKQAFLEIFLHRAKLDIIFDTRAVDHRQIAQFTALTDTLGLVEEATRDFGAHGRAGSRRRIAVRMGAGLAGVLKASSQTVRVVSSGAVDFGNRTGFWELSSFLI